MGIAGADLAKKVKDPVCGMYVDPHMAKHETKQTGTPLLLLFDRLLWQFRRLGLKSILPGEKALFCWRLETRQVSSN